MFAGAGVDGVLVPVRRVNEFRGTARLHTFPCIEGGKNPQVERYLSDYRAHLEKVFGKA